MKEENFSKGQLAQSRRMPQALSRPMPLAQLRLKAAVVVEGLFGQSGKLVRTWQLALLMLLAVSLQSCKGDGIGGSTGGGNANGTGTAGQTGYGTNGGDSLASAGQATPQLADLSKQILANPQRAELFYERAGAFLSYGNTQLALKDYKRAFTIDSTKSEYAIALAQLYFDKPEPDTRAGLGVMTKFLGYRGEDDAALWKMAELTYLAKQHRQSLEVLNRILQLDVQNARAYFMKGMNWKEAGNDEKAISSFQTAIEVNPRYFEAFMQLGLLFSKENDPLAFRYYDNALALNDTSTLALYAKAKFHQDRQELADAIDHYRKVVILDAQNADALYNLGTIYYGIDSTAKALRHFEMTTKIAPERAMAYFGKGLCAEQLGKSDEAIVFYQQALNLNEDLAEASESLARLRK